MKTIEPRDCRGKTGRKRCAEVTFRRRPGGWQPETYTVAVVLRGEDASEADFARQGELILQSRKGHLFQVEGWKLEGVREWAPEFVPPEPTRTVSPMPLVPLKVGYHQTLSEVMAALGWTHERPDPGDADRLPGRRVIYRADGSRVGLLDVTECWDFLRIANLIAPAKDETP